ncbi:unnamed protein product [Ectocarpus sp. 12 AP-2014]
MSSTPAPSDIVRKAAEEDSKASLETWGPEAFARRTRTKIHNLGAPLPPWESKEQRPTPAARGIPKSINIILLGPTGSGKSSLVYTWWRALSGSVTGKEEFLAEHVHDSFLQRLRVGWNAKDGEEARQRAQQQQQHQHKHPALATGASSAAPQTAPGGGALLKAAPRHGTKGLDAFQLQAPDPHRGCTGITVHDTKGQQFFTEEEERFAEQMLQGKVEEGSAVDKQNYKYWFMLGNFGFFSTASLAAAPHVVVLVFDVTLRSFQQMLREPEANELCRCYRKIVRRAAKQGHEVFAVLTHIDAYAPDEDDVSTSSDWEEEEEGTEAETEAETATEEGSLEQSAEASPGGGGSNKASSNAQESSLNGHEGASNAKTSSSSGMEHPSNDNESAGAGEFDREAELPGIISLWCEGLSQALGNDPEAPLPKENVFAVQNYHQGGSAQDPVLDLASLECLESVLHAGGRYVDERYQQQQEGCAIA